MRHLRPPAMATQMPRDIEMMILRQRPIRMEVPLLQPIIALRIHAVRVVIRPRRTRILVLGIGSRRRVDVGDLRWHLEELQREALADVPADMAVHQPGTWVVGFESDDGPAGAGEHGDVAAGRVFEVEQVHHAGGVEGAVAGAQEGEVVAVEMHWMGDDWSGLLVGGEGGAGGRGGGGGLGLTELILNDPECPDVGFFEDHDVTDRCE